MLRSRLWRIHGYRQQAERLRREAQATNNPEIGRLLLQLAEQYETLADRIEKMPAEQPL